MSNFLHKIKETVENRVKGMQDFHTVERNSTDFCNIFKNNKSPCIIAEIKFASPSNGAIYPSSMNALQIAHSYYRNGASALSILTEPYYFAGSIEYILSTKQAVRHAPILCKDFIMHEKQIAQACVMGASAVLLIVSLLSKDKLSDLYNYALSLNLTPFIEIHNLAELEIALSLSPRVIGINNRNLKNLQIDQNVSRQIIKHIPNYIYTICESGIQNAQQLSDLTKLGFDGFLMGSHFMRYANPGIALHQLLQEFSNAS